MSPNPFFMWSIAEAWDWLINVPFLGIVTLVAFGLLFLLFIQEVVRAGSRLW